MIILEKTLWAALFSFDFNVSWVRWIQREIDPNNGRGWGVIRIVPKQPELGRGGDLLPHHPVRCYWNSPGWLFREFED